MKSNNILKTYLFNIGKFFAIAAAFVFLAVGAMQVKAQAVNLDQCANGKPSAHVQCIDNQWLNGDLNAAKSHYQEDQSVPYRNVITGLTAGQTYALTLQYDTTKGGKHAIDYLTTYNQTETNADPCNDVTGCSLVQVAQQIPIDLNVTKGQDQILGTSDDITQIPGYFYISGTNEAGIHPTTLSGYTLTGSYAGDSSTSITVTFTPTQSTVVLTWSGHIASRLGAVHTVVTGGSVNTGNGWGIDNSAINIPGSPYHMRNTDFFNNTTNTKIGIGQTDKQLAVTAVIFPAKVFVFKQLNVLTGDQDPNFPFTFNTVTPNGSFSLVDDHSGNILGAGDTLPTIAQFNAITGDPAYANDFSVINLIGPFPTTGSVTEAPVAGINPQVVCTAVQAGGGSTSGATVTPMSITATATVNWTLNEANLVYCVYKNTNATVTAATASVSGKVTTKSGKGIKGATVTVADIQTGKTVSAKTDAKGNYTISKLEEGDFFTISVSAAGYTFSPASVTRTLNNDETQNFTANQ